MGHLDYLALRVIRHFMPSLFVDWLMHLRIGIQPGMETRQPETAVLRYEAALHAMGRDLRGKCVMILGYGGFFGTGVALLKHGARHVVLVDPIAHPHRRANLELGRVSDPFLRIHHKRALPNPEWITLIHEDLCQCDVTQCKPVDMVFSSSVYEHLRSPEAMTEVLIRWTDPQGCHLHFIDLRDHFFKYPFEMLCYSMIIWQRFLNPSSNHNRLRAWDFERIFCRHFREVKMNIIENDREAFRNAKRRIHEEYISGDEGIDSATRILIEASHPLTS
jgi:hypothetical protein